MTAGVDTVRLTQFAHGGGCACKIPPGELEEMVRGLTGIADADVLVGLDDGDDAAAVQITDGLAVLATADFFTPVVDDAYDWGRIAAANGLSDIYAMGGRPLTALNIIGFPEDLVRPRVVSSILRGGLAKAAEVGCVIIGGHSIRNPEPIYGLAVTGLVDVRRVTTNANARPGDALVLTKPLGTGIATTAIKRGMASRALEKNVIALMSQINTVGAELAELGLVRAATDITGYGLIGHLISLCRASGVSADIDPAAVPIISYEIHELVKLGCVPQGTQDNLNATTVLVDWAQTDETCQILLTDAQTSGGLLLCVAEANLKEALRVLRKAGTHSAALIGRIVPRRRRRPLVCMTE
jgi:selenide,water dikinase